MINISIGKLKINDNGHDGACLNIEWGIKNKNAPFDDEPTACVSGVGTRPFHKKIEQWRVLSYYNTPTRLELLKDIIDELPIEDDELAEWLKYWTKKALNELGSDAYFYYD